MLGLVTVNRVLTLGGLGGTSKPWAGAPDLVVDAVQGLLKLANRRTEGPAVLFSQMGYACILSFQSSTVGRIQTTRSCFLYNIR